MLKPTYVDAPVRSEVPEQWAILKLDCERTTYYVSTLGRIWSTRSGGRLLKGKNCAGHLALEYTGKSNKLLVEKVWSKPGKISRETVSFQRLVATTFLQRPKKANIVRHIDGNKLNNSVSNLEWTTCSEIMKKNARDSVHTARKLDAKQVLEIRKLINRKNPPKIDDIAALYKVSSMSIYSILTGNVWKNVPGPIRAKKVQNKRSPAMVRKMRDLYKKGFTNQEIAVMFKQDPSTTLRIVRGKYYKWVV